LRHPFTPALPLYYAFREALDMVLEEGMENRIRRHRICAEAFYAGLSALGLTPFAKPDARSNMIIAVNYLPGMDDKKFRGLLSNEFKVLIAGGFGDSEGQGIQSWIDGRSRPLPCHEDYIVDRVRDEHAWSENKSGSNICCDGQAEGAALSLFPLF